MGKTSIEWTDFSINPIRARWGTRVGHYCEKVSPGCRHCYSSRLQPRFGLPTFQHQRNAGIEISSSPDAPGIFLDASKLQDVLKRKKPTRWFWCDMTDLFGEWVPFEWISACFGVMAHTPQHTHQILTKRPERALEWFRWVDGHGLGPGKAKERGAKYWGVERPWPLPNVWLGVSVEDQKRADERIPLLLQCPAAVRFLSVEPLLESVDLEPWLWPTCDARTREQHEAECMGGMACNEVSLDWVIVGGESGPGARPCNAEWIRSIVHQCADAKVACFVKQLGAYPYNDKGGKDFPVDLRGAHRKGGDMSEWPHELRVRQFPEVRHD